MVALLLAVTLAAGAHAAERHTRNVVLITLDGVRTQEIFGGLDLDILKSVVKKGRVEEQRAYQKYWAATPQQRREKLMPFFWGTWMKKHGHIYGNRSQALLQSPTNIASHILAIPKSSPVKRMTTSSIATTTSATHIHPF